MTGIDDGSIADLPWAQVFDPTTNLAALTRAQARGVRAARAVVDRIIAGDAPELARLGCRPRFDPDHDALRLSVRDGVAAAPVWLHHRGAHQLGPIRLRCSELRTHDGAVIESDCVRFEPELLVLPAGASRATIVVVQLPAGRPPGQYRGTLLAEGQDAVWLPLVLTLPGPEPGSG